LTRNTDLTVDALIIGGGFYGSTIAIYLANQRRLKRVVLVERESALLTRASYNNQARVHNGCHYPRSFNTAYRSSVNMPRFVRDWSEAVKHDFTNLYAIARRNSKVTTKQFARFCKEIDVKIHPADQSLRQLFEPLLIEEIFLVEEYCFDANILQNWAERKLNEYGVEIRFESCATAISKYNNLLKVDIQQNSGSEFEIFSHYVFNCTYSGLNQFWGDFPGTNSVLKQEITEMALMDLPPTLKGLGVTVMDGPFFSIMPFPSNGLHTLSHVRYTPHMHWTDQKGIDPYQKLKYYERSTQVGRMVRDVARYLPAVLDAKYIESLFEVKTVLVKNETDDGRPILFEKHSELPGCYSVLGGKIDNIYDILERLNEEVF
jgi:glycine/D-amino acid oxidase-like deaminating enzyme